MNETESQTLEQKHGMDQDIFNPVIITAHNTVGMLLMGLLSLALLVALLRSQSRYRQLLESVQIEVGKDLDCC